MGTGGALDKVWYKRPKQEDPGTSRKAVAYADANHGIGIDDRRSVSGTFIQVHGGPIS